ncbi:MAG: DMT family transporter [Rhodobacteraceae bacterium]|nr:DMT family transporter [Paracoccaceae bacterium]
MSNLNSAQNARGAWLMIGGMAMIGFVDNFIGPMAEVIGLWQFQIQRSIIAVPTLILLSVFGVLSVRPKFLKPVLLRSSLIAFGMMWYFGALGFIPLSQALAGLFTSPIWVLLFTALFRGIPVSRAQWFAVCLSFLGALMVLDIWGDRFSLASAMPIVAGLFWAMGAIVTRDYCSQETPSAMLVLDPVVPEGSAGFIVRPWTSDWRPAWWILLLQAWGSLVGVGLMTRAYQVGEASIVAIFEYSVFLFGSVFALMLFGQTVDFWQGAGFALIILGGVIIVLRSGRESA